MLNVPTFVRKVFADRLRAYVRHVARQELANQFSQGVVREELINHLNYEFERRFSHFASTRRLMAAMESVHYFDTHMKASRPCPDRFAVIEGALQQASPDGLYLEFGVWRGQSINFIANRVQWTTVHGFDSFRGLPEDWFVKKGVFDLQGILPEVESNVRLHAGWFHEVLPAFKANHPGNIAFLHIDCDLYSSTKTVFSHLADRIRKDCVIVFDEYYGYPGWQDHEYKAFQEFLGANGLRYRYVCHNENEWQVAVRIT